MGSNISRLNYLLQRYTDGKATPSERQELMEAVWTGDQEESVRQWILAAIEQYEGGRQSSDSGRPQSSDSGRPQSSDRPEVGKDEDLSEEKAERILEGIFQSEKVGEVVPMWSSSPQRLKRRGVVWMAAAAIFLLVAGIGGYWQLTQTGAPKAIANNTPQPDVAPGIHAAMLTLANGQKVLLDSAMSDTVGKQGNTTIINMKGLLAFKGTSAGAAASTSAGAAAGTSTGAASELAYNTLTTNPGNQYQLILPDGSKVWLNAASSIRFPVSFGEKERKVEIIGEAYFEVVSNAQRPFLVQHGATTVTVLGTNFNINTYADEQSVTATLLEGAISIGQDGSSKVIRPGQQARVNEGGRISVTDNVNTEEVVAWKNDLFYFRSADIRTIMRQLARWYDIRVEYGKEDIGERFYAKLPKSAHLSEALDALALTGKVHFVVEGRTVTVRP